LFKELFALLDVSGVPDPERLKM